MDNKKKYEYRDSSGIEHCVDLEPKNFQLAQQDKTIHDQKFKTKPTTFFKDALKRFGKNKSSVVGAVILGILLLASIIIPIVDTSDLNVPRPKETFLAPKLFDAGTGFWDGTKKFKDIPCDPEQKETLENGKEVIYPDLETYSKNAIIDISEPRIGYVNSATRLAKNGFAQLINSNDGVVGTDYEDLKSGAKELSSKSYNFDLGKEYSLEVAVLNEKLEGYAIADYEIALEYTPIPLEEVTPEGQEGTTPETIVEGETNPGETTDPEGTDPEGETTPEEPEEEKIEPKEIVLKAIDDKLETKQIPNEVEKDKPFNVEVFSNNDILKQLRETLDTTKFEATDIKIKINVFPLGGSKTSLLVNSVKLSSTQDLELEKNDIISFTDANEFVLRNDKADNVWKYNDIKNLYKGFASVCDFTYDTYEAAYGVKEEKVDDITINTYIDKGWLDPKIKDNYSKLYIQGTKADTLFQTFVLNKDKLPIIQVLDVSRNTFGDVVSYTFTAKVSGYKLLGYDSMPRFLAGTDKDGYNLLKQVFVGLRNSLGLGLLTFAICFSFGLVFGAICGYFGGTIDIALQRFVDILSGVPWIVIMTLCILHLGSNFWTFILAMCLTGWIGTSSLTRTQFYRFRDREYTLASRTLGASNPRLIFRHILPNAMGTIITSSVLMIPSVIFSEATISYLGLGFQDMTSLGVTLSQNQTYLLTYPHLILFPSFIMALIMISFNLFGNGLRDAFNPSLKGSE